MKNDMTQGKEWKTILLFSLPIVMSNLLQVLYNLVDSIIVGQFISSKALGAVGLTNSMTWLLVAICSSLGSGTNIMTAQYYGAKKDDEIQETVISSYVAGLILTAVLTALCFLLSGPVIRGFLQAPEEMAADSISYFCIYGSGIIWLVLYNITYGILRAHGDSKGSLIFLIISSIVNVILDLIFIVNLHWGVAGAAIATVASQAGSAIASIIYMLKLFPELRPKKKYLYAFRERASLLVKLSVPIALQQAITSMGFIVLQRLINSFGTPSIEGYSAMLKIEQLAHIPSNSFNVAISSFTGQNIGAHKMERARKGYISTIIMGVGISLAISVVVLIFDEQLFSMFGLSGEALKRGTEHLDLLMMFIWVSTITNITCGFLQGAGDVRIPAMSGFVNLGIRLALSFMLAESAFGYRCYFISMPPAWVIACLFVVSRYISGKWKNYAIAK